MCDVDFDRLWRLAWLGNVHEVYTLAFELDFFAVRDHKFFFAAEIDDLTRLSGLEKSLIVNEDAPWTNALKEILELLLVGSSEDFLSIALVNLKHFSYDRGHPSGPWRHCH